MIDHRSNRDNYRCHSIVNYRFERRAASIVQDLIDSKYVSGYLRKWSPVIGRGWQIRYFSLLENDKTLVYWKKKPTYKDEQPLGSINLKIIENIFADGPLGITLSTPQRDYQLRASTPTEKDKWMDAIILWTIKSRKFRSKTEDLKNFRFSNMLVESTQSCLNYIFESFLKPYKKSAIRAPEVGPETLSNSNKKKFLKDRGIYHVLYKAWLVSKEIREERRNNGFNRDGAVHSCKSNDCNRHETCGSHLCNKETSEFNYRAISMCSPDSELASREKLCLHQNTYPTSLKANESTLLTVDDGTCSSNDISASTAIINFNKKSVSERRGGFAGKVLGTLRHGCVAGANLSETPQCTNTDEGMVKTQIHLDHAIAGELPKRSRFQSFTNDRLEVGFGAPSPKKGENAEAEPASVEGRTSSVTWEIDYAFMDYEGDDVIVPINSKYCIYDEGCPITIEQEEEYSRQKQHKYSLQLSELMLKQLYTPQKEIFLDNCIFGLIYITRSNPRASFLKNSGIYWGLMISSRSLGEAHYAYPSPVLGERIIFGNSLECYKDIDLGLMLKSKCNDVDTCNYLFECGGGDLTFQRSGYSKANAYQIGINDERVVDKQTNVPRNNINNVSRCYKEHIPVFEASAPKDITHKSSNNKTDLMKSDNISGHNAALKCNIEGGLEIEGGGAYILCTGKERLPKIPKTFDHRYEISNTLVSSIKSNLINNVFPMNISAVSGNECNNGRGFGSIFRSTDNNQPIDPYGFLLDTLYLYYPRNESKNPIYMLDPGRITSIGPISETMRGFVFTVTFMGNSALEDEIARDLEYIDDSPSNIPFCSEFKRKDSPECYRHNNYDNPLFDSSPIIANDCYSFKNNRTSPCRVGCDSESQMQIPNVSTSTPNSNSNFNAVLSGLNSNNSSYDDGFGGVSSYITALETLSSSHVQTQNSSNYTKDDISIYNNNYNRTQFREQIDVVDCVERDSNTQIGNSRRSWNIIASDENGEVGTRSCDKKCNTHASNFTALSQKLIPITIEFCTRSWRDARAWRYSLIVTRKSRMVDSISMSTNNKGSGPCSSSLNSGSHSAQMCNHNLNSTAKQKRVCIDSSKSVTCDKGGLVHAKSACTKERQYNCFDSCPTLTTTASSSARTSNGHHLINYRRELSGLRANRH